MILYIVTKPCNHYVFNVTSANYEEPVGSVPPLVSKKSPLRLPPPPPPPPPFLKVAPTIDPDLSPGSTTVLMGLKVLSEIFLTCLVLLCTVFSKLSLVGLTDNVREISRLVPQNGSGLDPSTVSRAVSLYWQLLLILLIPNCITFMRCMFFGLIGKSSQSFPLPNQVAFIGVRATAFFMDDVTQQLHYDILATYWEAMGISYLEEG